MKNNKFFFKVDIIRNYLKKFPNTPSLTLAKKIYSENREHFHDVENARDSVRYCRGLRGKKNKKSVGEENRKFFIKKNRYAKNPFGLPRSYGEKPKQFALPSEHNNILVLSDLHVPYHDINAISIALQYGLDHSINTVFINGDLVDFYQISRFVNVERKRSVRQELQAAEQVLNVIHRTFPNAPIYWLKGNHDNRLETYLAVKAPELLDVEEFKLEVLLDTPSYNTMVLDDTTLVKMGKLNVSHGHLVIRGIFAPVNAARGTFLRAKASTLISHVHKVSSHSETTIGGKNITCYSTGCLCELAPRYAPFGNNNSHGFAHVITQPNGNYRVTNKQIINGEIVT